MPETPDPSTGAPSGEGAELERSITLWGATAIGVGTMIGAGIFVFPGLAAGQAGPAAAASFALGGVVAILVALPTSEMATAMPRSGGGYFYISRAMGTLPGSLVGISLWSGLVFASGFYLVGFGAYAEAVLAELGLGVGNIVVPVALTAGALLVGVSILGTENVTKLQNLVVSLLLAILLVFLSYGGLDALGVFGTESTPEAFAPFGYPPVLTTAALVFTSYLGFAQVATVAGEVKDPGVNLPRAMVGSVLLVGVLYVVTIFVATSTMGSQALSQAGETAIVEVARTLLGVPGVVAILLAGLLATFSSANASLLSSSRTVYALAKDRLLPPGFGKVNLRFGTPHVSLLLAGAPTLVLVATGQVELLAEVASLLHLVMYAGMCFALVVFRRAEYDWYDPAYEVPLGPVIPVVGGLSCLALIFFMQPTSQIVGLAVLGVSGLWHLVYARDVDLKGVLG